MTKKQTPTKRKERKIRGIAERLCQFLKIKRHLV